MSGEVVGRVVLLEDLEDDRGQRLDDVVTTKEAVVVVVALEGIDVRVQDREALVLCQPPRDLAKYVAVAAHPGERAQPTRGRRSRHHRTQSRHELLGHERLGHVIVGAREEVLDLVFQRITHGEEDDRDQTGSKVLTELRHDLVAGRVAEHQVEQDDVGAPLDGRVVRAGSLADGHALKARSLEDPLDEAQDLLVVVDHERDVPMRQGGTRMVGAGLSHNGHAGCFPGRGSFSVIAIAFSAAALISLMSAFTASGSPVSSAIRSL